MKQLHVAEDGSYTTKGEISDDSVTVKYTSIDDLQKAKRFLPQLCVPAYIPEGYGLQSLSVTKTGDGSYIADYVFQNVEEEFYITQMGGFPAEASVSIYGTVPEKIALGESFVSEPLIGETLVAGIIKENEIISISGDEISENELFRIAESMEFNE